MAMGAGSPEQFISILRMDDAALSRQEKPLVMASCHKSLRFEDASANMPRLFGLRGGGSRQDALLTEEAAESPLSDTDLDVLAAYRKANKNRGRARKRRKVLRNGAGIRCKGSDRH